MAKNLKEKLVKPVYANRGIEAAYRAALKKLIAEMHGSIEYWLSAAFRKAPPRMTEIVEMAKDAESEDPENQEKDHKKMIEAAIAAALLASKLSKTKTIKTKTIYKPKKVEAAISVTPRRPVSYIKKVVDRLSKRWKKRFKEAAPKMAETYITRQFNATHAAFTAALKEQGWLIEFENTPAMQDALQAAISENISLINSIPEHYLTQVEGIVMRTYGSGQNLGRMTYQLKKLYPKAGRRAAIITFDQINKANSVVTRTRQLELGIKKARWFYTHRSKNKRQVHIQHHGVVYNLAEGCYMEDDEGIYRHIQPGELPYCKCLSIAILPNP